MSSLNLSDYTPKVNGVELTPEQQLAKAGQVKTMGIIALILLITGIIPILGIFGLITSLILSRYALRIARDNYVPDGYERPAHWASIISTVILILWVIGLLLMLLR